MNLADIQAQFGSLRDTDDEQLSSVHVALKWTLQQLEDIEKLCNEHNVPAGISGVEPRLRVAYLAGRAEARELARRLNAQYAPEDGT